MVTRRELVTTGALGAFSAASAAEANGTVNVQSNEQATAEALRAMQRDLSQIREILDDGLRQPLLGFGVVGPIRKQFEVFLRTTQKYPDYCEVGTTVFTELYDWHVKHKQPLETSRVDNRMAIRFMFTWMILVPHQDPSFIGIPFDRG